MKRLTSVVAVFCLAGVTVGHAAEPNQFTLISWNVDSGGADPHVVASRISEMKGVDLWGFCRVRDESWARLFAQAAGGMDSGRFIRIVSPTAGSDRSCILYDKTQFDCLGSWEFSWAGQPWYSRELGLRPGLVAHLQHRTTGQELYFMVNWLHGPTADKQASILTEWAADQDIPIIAVGTYDFEYRTENLMSSPTTRRGYPTLTAGGVFQWLMPDNPVPTVLRGDLGVIDDFVLLADKERKLTGRSLVIVQPDDFPDSNLTPDHRPVSATLTVRTTGE